MTAFEHKILAGIVFFILWQLFLKRLFRDDQSVQEWEDIIRKWLSNK